MIDIDLKIKHFFSGREYAKQMSLDAGGKGETHKHNFDHLSILAVGEVLVNVDGVETRYLGPTCIIITANQVHRIDAITDSVWFCVHATTELDPERIDQTLIKHG